MFQETARRFVGDGFASPLVVCNDEHRFIIAAQIQNAGITPQAIILEPKGRNTAPAAAVAALMLMEISPDTLMLLAPSDHVVDNREAFHATVRLAASAAADGHLVTFGIQANRPETGYGYIRKGAAIGGGAFAVSGFVEKPDLPTAKRFVDAGDYFWNAGIFLFSPAAYLEELARHAPEILARARDALDRGVRDLDFLRLDRDSFGACPSVSIDYAVMEHTKKAAVVPADMGWSDIGSWSVLWERSTKDEHGNALIGDVIVEDARANLIRSDGRLVAALGVENLIIVATSDAVLVSARERDQDVKRIVERLVKTGRSEANQHPRVYRPWGFFESLHHGEGTQVKLIEVSPGASLSLQYHHKRAEHWVVVAGEAWVTRGDDSFTLKQNESTFIPIGERHRLENRTSKPLQLIEVQVGSYLGEDDIVRLEDKYKRSSTA